MEVAAVVESAAAAELVAVVESAVVVEPVVVEEPVAAEDFVFVESSDVGFGVVGAILGVAEDFVVAKAVDFVVDVAVAVEFVG